jgi:hypothetical protein
MSSSNPAPIEDQPANGRTSLRQLPYKSVALPAEKGSWSLVSEPILLGMLVAPSWAGLALAVGAFALFLFNRPLKVFLGDRRKGRVYDRTRLAQRFIVLYGAIAVAGCGLAWLLGGWRPFVPFLIAAPLLALFMIYDQRPGRYWQAELAAPAAFAAVVTAITLAGSLEWRPSLALWGFMIARSVPAVLFVRARLRLDKGKAAGPGDSIPGALLAHLLAIGLVIALYRPGWLPWTAVLAVILLLARAIWGLSGYRWRSSVVALGFLETGFGALSVLLVALGFWLS